MGSVLFISALLNFLALLLFCHKIKPITKKINKIKVNPSLLDLMMTKDSFSESKENKINIPVEFYDSDLKFKDVSKITELFKSKNGKVISYYDNGKPVYKK